MFRKNKSNTIPNIDKWDFYNLNQLVRKNKIRIFDYRTQKELFILQDVANSVDGTFDIFIKNEDLDLINELKKYTKLNVNIKYLL